MCIIKLNNQRCRALFDTGADSSVLSLSWFRKNETHFGKLQSSTKRLINASGKEMDLRGSIMARVSIGPCTKTCQFSVINGVRQECIVGNDIMQSIGVVLDLGKRKISYGSVDSKQSVPRNKGVFTAYVAKNVKIQPLTTRTVRLITEKSVPEGTMMLMEEEKGHDRAVALYPGVARIRNGRLQTVVGNPTPDVLCLERKTPLCSVSVVNPNCISPPLRSRKARTICPLLVKGRDNTPCWGSRLLTSSQPDPR